MRSGQEPLTICKLEFLFFQSITGRDPRRCKISDESADFNKWWNSDNLASPTMRGFLRDRVGLELNDTRGLREFLDRSHANWLATMLACLMLHEFAHHLHGDIGHGTETDAARQAREVAADNYAVSFTQRVPESDDLWKDFFRINLTSAYAMNSFFMLVAYKYDRQSLPDSDERFRISGRYFLKMLELVKTDPEFLKLMPVSVTELNTIRQSVEGDLRDQMKK